VGIAIGLGAQEVISDFISGVFLMADKNFSINDLVRVGDVYGIVRIVKLRTTEIKTFDENIVTVPNSHITSNSVINMTTGG